MTRPYSSKKTKLKNLFQIPNLLFHLIRFLTVKQYKRMSTIMQQLPSSKVLSKDLTALFLHMGKRHQEKLIQCKDKLQKIYQNKVESFLEWSDKFLNRFLNVLEMYNSVSKCQLLSFTCKS